MPANHTKKLINQTITVTDKLIIVGEKSYSILNIKSVEVKEIPTNRAFGGGATLLGVFLVACTLITAVFSNILFTMTDTFDSNAAVLFTLAGPPLLCGVIVLLIGLITLIMAKKHYAVEIGYAGEPDKPIFTSRSRSEVEEISRAIKQALEKSSNTPSIGY